MRNYKGWSVIILIVFMLGIVLTGCGGEKTEAPSGNSQEPAKKVAVKELSLAHTQLTDKSNMTVTYKKFKELVEAKTNGEIKIKLYGGSTLAGDQTAVEGAQRGTIDIGSSGTNNMAPFTKKLLFGDLPYIMNSLKDSYKVWDGPIGEQLKKELEEELGVKSIMFCDPGSFRVLSNNKHEVKVPADLKGLKIRATASPVELALLKAWGANPTPIPWPELYTSLEQKVVDGTYVQYRYSLESKHTEALKYYTEVGGVQNLHLLMMAKKTWEGLTPDQQKAVMEAADEAQSWGFNNAVNQMEELREEIRKTGGEIYIPTPEEMEQWRSIKDEVWNQFKDTIDQDLIKSVVEAQK